MSQQQPTIYFSDTFRIKLEAMLRLLQQHTTSSIKRMGREIAQSIHDNLFSDMLHILYRVKDDDGINYSHPDPKEWRVFTQIMTDEFNHLNKEVQGLFLQVMPDVLLLTKFNLLTVSSCDRIIDLLNAEFNLMYSPQSPLI